MMKTTLLAALILSTTVVAGDAFATEGPSHWAGWYAGIEGGYARTNDSLTDKNYFNNAATADHIIAGGTVGLVGGYNWVKSDGLFYGAEADINYMSNSGDLRECPGCSFNDVENAIERARWSGYGTLRGRIGMAFDPALVFLTGGLAVADVKDQWIPAGSGGGGITQQPGDGFSKSGINFGLALGAGTEFAVAEKFSVSLQYLYLQMLERPTDLICTGCTPVHNGYLINNSASILRVGVNYHIN